MTATKPEVEPTGRYSVRKTAEHLGISTRTVYRYINESILKAQYRKATKKPYITGLEIIKVWNQTF